MKKNEILKRVGIGAGGLIGGVGLFILGQKVIDIGSDYRYDYPDDISEEEKNRHKIVGDVVIISGVLIDCLAGGVLGYGFGTAVAPNTEQWQKISEAVYK